MTAQLHIGDDVGWAWAGSIAVGTVVDVRPERTQVESKKKLITRNGSPADPAVIIKQKSGTIVLKLAHELQRLHKSADNDTS